jgi:hypothetical protein
MVERSEEEIMPRGRPGESYQNWLMQKRAELERLAKDRVRLLPPDLQKGILEACEGERARLLARIQAIDASIEDLGPVLEEAKALRRGARIPVKPPVKHVRRIDGTTRTIEPKDGRFVKGQAAIAAARTARNVKAHIAAFEREKQGRRTELRNVRQIEAAAEEGVVTALLQITRRWAGQIGITDLQPEVRMAGARHSDRFGNPLPAEALDPDGTPHDFGTMAEAQAEAGRPLSVGQEVRYGHEA